MDERTTAIHEAGHVIAFYRLFGDVRYGGRVTIKPTEDAAGSHKAEYLWFPADNEETPEERAAFDNEAVYACAGYAAVLAAGYSEGEASAGCESDFDEAKKVTKPLATIKQEAVALMSRPENVNAVRRIADELLMRTTLDPEVVDVLVDVADGKTTEEEYQRFLALMRYSKV